VRSHEIVLLATARDSGLVLGPVAPGVQP
jgi:hypothetical protein